MNQHEGKFKIGIEAAIALVLMAGVPIFIKFTGANTFTIGFFRLGVATVLFLFFLKPFKTERPLNKSMILPLISIGLLFAIHWLTYFFSIKKATASIGMLGMSTYGIHLIFLGWLIRKDRPGVLDFFALSLAILGMYFIIPEFSLSNDHTFGILLGTVSGFCFALLPVLHQQYNFIPERLRIFGQFFFALVIFIFFFPLTDWQLKSTDWWSLLYLAVFGTFIAHSLWVRVTTKISTKISSIIFYLLIPMTMVLSYFWIDEQMPWPKIAGAILLIIGNILSLGGKLRMNA